MKIREYTDTDREVLTQALEALHDYVVSLDPLKRLRKMPGHIAQEVEKTLTTVANQKGKIFIAEKGGVFAGCIIGFVTKQSDENLLSVVPNKLGVISDVYVAEKYRGEHIGQTLMEKMEAYLKEQGCDNLWIDIVAFNTNAQAFYTKQGYAPREIGLLKKL